jgi:surface antigen
MGKLRIVAAALAALSLGACAGGPQQTSASGVGAFSGDVVGSTSGNRVPVAAAGPPSGILGTSGVALDERDRQLAYDANMRALQSGEPGVPVVWRSQVTGHHGTIVPGPAYQAGGSTCREFSHIVYLDGRPQATRGTACRNPDGSWTPAS